MNSVAAHKIWFRNILTPNTRLNHQMGLTLTPPFAMPPSQNNDHLQCVLLWVREPGTTDRSVEEAGRQLTGRIRAWSQRGGQLPSKRTAPYEWQLFSPPSPPRHRPTWTSHEHCLLLCTARHSITMCPQIQRSLAGRDGGREGGRETEITCAVTSRTRRTTTGCNEGLCKQVKPDLSRCGTKSIYFWF